MNGFQELGTFWGIEKRKTERIEIYLLFWLLVRLPGVDFQNSAVARDG